MQQSIANSHVEEQAALQIAEAHQNTIASAEANLARIQERHRLAAASADDVMAAEEQLHTARFTAAEATLRQQNENNADFNRLELQMRRQELERALAKIPEHAPQLLRVFLAPETGTVASAPLPSTSTCRRR